MCSLRYLQYQDSGEDGDASSSNGVPPKRTTHLMPMSHSRSVALDLVKGKLFVLLLVLNQLLIMSLFSLILLSLLIDRHRPLLSDIGSIGDLENQVDSSISTANSWTRLPSISRMVEAQDMRRKRRLFRASASLDNCKSNF